MTNCPFRDWECAMRSKGGSRSRGKASSKAGAAGKAGLRKSAPPGLLYNFRSVTYDITHFTLPPKL
jgi:hypothetical protein